MAKEKATIEDLELELWLRRRNRREIIWTTKLGHEIPINDMTDEHLSNCIRILEEMDTQSECMDCWPEIEDAGNRP